MTATIAELGERALRRLGIAVVPVADRPALTVQVPRADIATAALVELGVIASDETPSATDQALALAKLASVQASLTAQALVWWQDDAVPNAVAEEYIKATALVLSSSFGKAADPNQWPALEARIRKVALVLSAPDLATGAVLTVHQNLTARGLARWSVFDVPAAAEDPYVSLAAVSLAPEFAGICQPPPRGDAAEAYRALAQIIALPTSGERVAAEYF